MDKLFTFLAGVFSDNGSPSFSRVASGLALAFACGWVTSVVRVTHALPDFAGIALFIGTLYGINTAKNMVNKPPTT